MDFPPHGCTLWTSQCCEDAHEDAHKGLWYASGPAEQGTGGLLACLLEDMCTADAQTADQPRPNCHQGLLQLLILYLLFQTPYSMLDCFRLDSTVHSNMGRTSGSGLVPIEGPTMQSGDQRCGTLQD